MLSHFRSSQGGAAQRDLLHGIGAMPLDRMTRGVLLEPGCNRHGMAGDGAGGHGTDATQGGKGAVA